MNTIRIGRFSARCAIWLGAILSPLSLRAQSVGDTIADYILEGVTVTTTRAAVDRSRIPQKLDVIESAAFERSAASNAAEALRRAVPVEIIEYPGLLSGVSMRGFRPEYSGTNSRTLVLLDGRPAGTSNLALLHLNDVERIEVLRGPASALYGASAMAGVINIVPRRSTGEWSGRASLGYGSYGNYEARASGGGQIAGGFDLDLGYAEVGQRSGYSTGSKRSFATDSLSKTLPDGSSVRLPWISADTVIAFTEYASRSGHARLGYAFAPHWRLDLRGEVYRADDVQNPGDLGAAWDGRSLKDVGRNSFEVALTGTGSTSTPSLRLFSAREGVDYFDRADRPNFISFRTPVHTYGAQLQQVLDLDGHPLTLGIDFNAAESESEGFDAEGNRTAPYNPNTGIHSVAGFLHGSRGWFAERLVLAGGVRVDQVAFHVRETPNLAGHASNSERHLVFTPNLGARYSGGYGVQLHANIGRAFLTPTAFQVAGYSEQRADDLGVRVTRGNPELRPETSLSWDLGVGWRASGFELDLTYFDTAVRDRVTTQLLTDDPIGRTAAGDSILSTTTYINADAASIRGIEVEGSLELFRRSERAARLFLNGTRVLHAEERFHGFGSAQRIRNVADLILLSGLDLEARKDLRFRVSARYVGERVDSDYLDWSSPGEILYPAYLVIDFGGTLRLAERYSVTLDLLNLADEDYFEVRGYNLPGRSLRLGLSASL